MFTCWPVGHRAGFCGIWHGLVISSVRACVQLLACVQLRACVACVRARALCVRRARARVQGFEETALSEILAVWLGGHNRVLVGGACEREVLHD